MNSSPYNCDIRVRMGFLVFAPVSFVILWLALRLRLRTSLWLAIIIGLVCDAFLDLMVARRG
jgi:hypothetical protein